MWLMRHKTGITRMGTWNQCHSEYCGPHSFSLLNLVKLSKVVRKFEHTHFSSQITC
jgi:hypothetical protein